MHTDIHRPTITPMESSKHPLVYNNHCSFKSTGYPPCILSGKTWMLQPYRCLCCSLCPIDSQLVRKHPISSCAKTNPRCVSLFFAGWAAESHREFVLAGQSKEMIPVGQILAVLNQVLVAAVSTPKSLIPAMNFHYSFTLHSRWIYL